MYKLMTLIPELVLFWQSKIKRIAVSGETAKIVLPWFCKIDCFGSSNGGMAVLPPKIYRGGTAIYLDGAEEVTWFHGFAWILSKLRLYAPLSNFKS